MFSVSHIVSSTARNTTDPRGSAFLPPMRNIDPQLMKGIQDLAFVTFRGDIEDFQTHVLAFLLTQYGGNSVKLLKSLSSILLPRLDFSQHLPLEISLHIFSFLSARDLCRCAVVCKAWRNISADASLWKRLVEFRKWKPLLDARQVSPFIARKFGPARSPSISSAPLSAPEADTSGSSSAKRRKINWKDLYRSRHQQDMAWRHNRFDQRDLKGHSDWIESLQFADDILVSASDDKTIKIWDLCVERRPKTRECVNTLYGHSQEVFCLQFSEERGELVTGSEDRTIRIWNMESGETSATLSGHDDGILCLQFSENTLVSGSRDATLRVWNLTDRSCVDVLRGHDDGVRCLHMAITGNSAGPNSAGRPTGLLVSGSYDYSMKVWDLATAKCTTTLNDHTSTIFCLQFVDNLLISGSRDHTMKAYDMRSMKCIRTITDHTDEVACLQFLDNKLLSGSYDKTVKIFDLGTWRCLSTLEENGIVSALQFTQDRLVTAVGFSTIRVRDVRAITHTS